MSLADEHTDVDPGPDPGHELVVSLVPAKARVLEFGGGGALDEVLRTRLRCSVKTIDRSPQVGEPAHKADGRIVGDVEQLDFAGLFGSDRLDAIVFVDVLEHLHEPGAVLARVRPLLADGGAIIAAVPNSAHGSFRLALLSGEPGAGDGSGPRPAPRHFLTRENLRDLFEAAGYGITHWLRERRPLGGPEGACQTRPVPEAVREWLANDPEATTYRFVVRAVRTEAAETLRHARSELASMTAKLADTQDQLAGARTELRELATRVEAMSRREAEFREMLLDAHDRHSQREDEHLRREDELRAQLQEQTAWAQRAVAEVAERDSIIRDLQRDIGRIRNSRAAWLYRAVRRVLTPGR